MIGRLEAHCGIRFQPVVRQGDPGSELLRFADDTDAGLIAAGTRGLGFVARLFLGSVARKVIRNSPLPVLTIPASDGAVSEVMPE